MSTGDEDDPLPLDYEPAATRPTDPRAWRDRWIEAFPVVVLGLVLVLLFLLMGHDLRSK
jgi:hypothetical protein